MTTTHRITTIAAVLLSLAAAGASSAVARPAFDPPTAGNHTPVAVYSRPDKAIIPAIPAASGAIAAKPDVPQSLTPQQRQRVSALAALSDKQLAAGFGVAPAIASTVSAPHAVVRVQTPPSGFDWGDAGIGAAGGLALAMLGLGAALTVSQRRPRRNRQTTTVS